MFNSYLGPDGIDGLCYTFPIPSPLTVNIPSIKVYNIDVAKSFGWGRLFLSKCDSEIIEAKNKAANYLSSCGCVVEDLVLPELLYAYCIDFL